MRFRLGFGRLKNARCCSWQVSVACAVAFRLQFDIRKRQVRGCGFELNEIGGVNMLLVRSD
jgi:hypothetical protein